MINKTTDAAEAAERVRRTHEPSTNPIETDFGEKDLPTLGIVILLLLTALFIAHHFFGFRL